MAIGMSNGKVDRVGLRFMQRLGPQWVIVEDTYRRYNYGAVIAERGDIRVVLDIGHAPLLRVAVLDSGDDIITLPFLNTDALGVLAADIANVVARAKEYEVYPGE